MDTILDGSVEQQGDLRLRSPAFEGGERMPDSVGYVNANENPPLEIAGVPEEAESLVLAMDHPDAAPIAGHAFDHWLVWDVDPAVRSIPEGWTPTDAVVGTNHYLERGYGGPSPPEGTHKYRFKLLALDGPLEAPPSTPKRRLGSLVGLDGAVGLPIAADVEVVAATELVGTYAAEQGTLF